VLPAFKLWLRFGKRVAGRVHVDAGAREAVAAGGRSLLAVGVVSVEGEFRAGEGVELVGPDGAPFARGIAAVGRGEAERRRPSVEVVHRDRLVLLDEPPPR
jgi:glutamate 5-kinase